MSGSTLDLVSVPDIDASIDALINAAYGPSIDVSAVGLAPTGLLGAALVSSDGPSRAGADGRDLGLTRRVAASVLGVVVDSAKKLVHSEFASYRIWKAMCVAIGGVAVLFIGAVLVLALTGSDGAQIAVAVAGALFSGSVTAFVGAQVMQARTAYEKAVADAQALELRIRSDAG